MNLIKKKNCGICSAELQASKAICFENVPAAAQLFLKNASSTKKDSINLLITECDFCGTIQTMNGPVPGYKNVIRSNVISEEMCKFRNKQFSNFIGEFNLHKKRILEIGCNKGENLHLLAELGMDATGIENNKTGVQIAQSKKVNVMQGFVSEKDILKHVKPFDAFFSFNVLEHWPEFRVIMRAINACLCKDGVGIVEVPNFDMIWKKKLFTEFISDHIYYFSKETLKNALSINGFKILDIKPVWNNYILSATVKKREKLPLESFLHEKKMLIHEFKNFFEKNANKKYAVWGAGHQSLTTISLADISEKIEFIIDSSKQKQNKVSPGSRLPIMDPNVLQSSDIQGVIVICGSFSNEVVRLIKTKYKLNIDIYIFEDNKILKV